MHRNSIQATQEAAMRHTVIGIFDTYDQAEVARSALVASGFARSDIELQAAPESSTPEDPTLAAATGQPPETGGVLANIERFFSMLFGGRDQPPEVAHYSEAVRRGAVLVAVDTATETLADTARQTLAEQGAIDIDERAASWGTLNHSRTARPLADEAESRDHSLLDELGLGSGSAVPGHAPVNPPADPDQPGRTRCIFRRQRFHLSRNWRRSDDQWHGLAGYKRNDTARSGRGRSVDWNNARARLARCRSA
jgi:hypothetical protein